MADMNKAKPGDILLYKSSGLLGDTISYFEWDSGNENLNYCHIGQVFDTSNSDEMNPPASRIFPLNQISWTNVDIYRFNINGKNPYDNPDVLKVFQNIVSPKRIGMKYDYGFILKSFGVDLLARLGMTKLAQKWTHDGNGTSNHQEVCSQFAQDNNEETFTQCAELIFGYNYFQYLNQKTKRFELFPHWSGDDVSRPSDWTTIKTFGNGSLIKII